MQINFKQIAIGLLLTVSSMIQARPEAGSWEVGAEFIYWKTLLEDTSYSVNSSNGILPNGSRLHNKYDYEPGWRLEGAYTCCDDSNDVRLRWTHLNGHDNAGTSNPFVLATQGSNVDQFTSATQAHSNARVRFDSLELLFGEILFCREHWDINGQIGLQYANYNYTHDTEYLSGVNVFQASNRNKVWGFGPEVSFDFNYYLEPSCWCSLPFTVTGRFTSALLISRSRPSTSTLDSRLTVAPVTPIQVDGQRLTRLIPMWDFRLGLGYDHVFCDCYQTHWELGWELLTYHRGIHTVRFYGAEGNDSGKSFDHFTDLSYSGPYFAFNVAF